MFATNRSNLLLLALFFCSTGFGQLHDSLLRYPDRYRLDLPKEWQKPRIIEAITEILPQTIDELKDRDFCTAGKAAFYIQLLIDSVFVDNAQTSPPVEIGSIPHYNYTFNYNFYAALMITDSFGKKISALQLNPTDQTMTYFKQFSLPRQNVVYRYVTVYDQRGRAVGTRLVEEAGPVNTFVPNIDPFSVLTEDFLLSICEKKIFEIKRILKKINNN